jgi:hypothetical protein
MPKLSVRRLWTMYKRVVMQEGLGRTKRDKVQVLTQNAFYSGELPPIFLTPRLGGMMQPEVFHGKADLQSGVQA